jgi:hypothetical protein
MFTIGTLTHDDLRRDEYLEMTVNTFLENTNLPENTTWMFFHNGKSDSPVIESIRKMAIKWEDKSHFMTFCENKNLGVGVGINKLNEWLKTSEYSLFLEGDWLTMPQEFTNQDKDWLIRSLDLMKKENIDQIQLRKYLNDVDDRQFGFGYWTNERNVEKVENGYVYLKEREYTNNPHIRNNQRYFDLDIFPLQEFYDENGEPTELKTSSQWGQAEVKAEGLGKQLKSVWLKGGIMVHCDHWRFDNNWEEAKKSLTGCDYDNGSLIHCKYGFTFSRPEFCAHCRKDKDFRDLEEHNWIFERNLK